MVVKGVKGFNTDMTCKNKYQYSEGEDFDFPEAKCCESGGHAVEYPLDVFSYYDPAHSVYHEVEASGDIDRNDNDSKFATTHLHIGARLSIAGLVKAAIEFTMDRIKPEASSDEEHGASSATGDYGASSATGYKGASSATGDYGASSATGNCGASSATGYHSSAEAGNPGSVAVSWGYQGAAKGVIGSYLVIAEWRYIGSEDDPYYDRSEEDAWELVGSKTIKIDGKKYKENTLYSLIDGEIVEVSEESLHE